MCPQVSVAFGCMCIRELGGREDRGNGDAYLQTLLAKCDPLEV